LGLILWVSIALVLCRYQTGLVIWIFNFFLEINNPNRQLINCEKSILSSISISITNNNLSVFLILKNCLNHLKVRDCEENFFSWEISKEKSFWWGKKFGSLPHKKAWHFAKNPSFSHDFLPSKKNSTRTRPIFY